MKKSTKAALLSAFIFPGAGHFYLKSYKTGLFLAGASFAAIYYLMAKAVERAFEISEKIQSGAVPLDAEAINNLVTQPSSGADAQALSIATTAIVVCWLIGIVDSYRLGRVRDKRDEEADNRRA